MEDKHFVWGCIKTNSSQFFNEFFFLIGVVNFCSLYHKSGTYDMLSVFRKIDILYSGSIQAMQLFDEVLFRADILKIRIIILVIPLNMREELGKPIISSSIVNVRRVFQFLNNVQDIRLNTCVRIIVFPRDDYLKYQILRYSIEQYQLKSKAQSNNERIKQK